MCCLQSSGSLPTCFHLVIASGLQANDLEAQEFHKDLYVPEQEGDILVGRGGGWGWGGEAPELQSLQ